MPFLPPDPRPRVGNSLGHALQGLRTWTARQALVAIFAGVLVAVLVGVATVLIPNPVFARDIPPVWWNYPVWVLTSALSGMLLATYVSSSADSTASPAEGDEVVVRRSSRMGVAGAVLAWFAVGCPVCNKLALIALGYSGAITWFAPVQPVLALVALLLTGFALLWRLRGQASCPLRPTQLAVSR